MTVLTDSERVRTSRRLVLELHVQANDIVNVTSPDDHDVTLGNLCVKSRFGYPVRPESPVMRVQVLYWQEIDRVAMEQGLIGSDAYLEQWEWRDAEPREGAPNEVLDAVETERAEGDSAA